MKVGPIVLATALIIALIIISLWDHKKRQRLPRMENNIQMQDSTIDFEDGNLNPDILSDNDTNSKTSINIGISGSSFNSTRLTIPLDSRITFINNDISTHTVTANDGAFDSGDIQPNSSFTYVFDKAGTYNYHDKYNDKATGTITVQ